MRPAPSTPTRRAAAVLAAALAGAGLAWWVAPRPTPTAAERVPVAEGLAGGADASGTGGGPDRAPGPGDRGVRVRPATVAAANRAASESAAPSRLTLPRLGLAVSVIPVGVDRTGAMALPESAYSAGWYRFGAGPSDPRGATVVAGHVDTRKEGTGPLALLASARAGDEAVVWVEGRRVRYRVVDVRRVAKAVLDLPSLFARSGPPVLRLVTCGGAYVADRGGYQDNVVVTARPL